MQKTFEIIFRDVYGGDGNIRYEDMEVTKLSRTKKSTKTRDDIGVAVDTAMEEVVTEKAKQGIQTFVYSDGHPTIRLGGTHGKLWGALKELRINLYMLGDKDFKSARLMNMIQISPVWASLEILEPIQVRQLPQILNTIGRTMITMYFDVIPLAKCQITIAYPDTIKKQGDKLIELLPTISLLNKRRATIRSMKETK